MGKHTIHSSRPLAAAVALAVISFALLAPSMARAQIIAVVTSPQAATASPGDTGVTFMGTLTNTSATDAYVLTGGFVSGFTSDPSMNGGAVYTDSIFFPVSPAPNSTLFTLGGGQNTYPASPQTTADLFSVNVDPSAPAGVYSGTFEVDGYVSGADPSTAGFLTTAAFTLTVLPAPEPSSWAVMGVGLLGLAALGWRARRQTV